MLLGLFNSPFFAARITNSGSKGKNPSYSSFRANAVSRGIFPSGRFYLVLVLFCHVRGFLHSAGAKGLNDMTGGVFCIIGNSSVLSRAERHIGRSLRFRWEGHVFSRGILRTGGDHMGRLYGFAYWFCNISRPPLPRRSGLRPAASRSGKPSPVGGFATSLGLYFSPTATESENRCPQRSRRRYRYR